MNTTNSSPQPNIEQIRDLLSPYLDNEVTTSERQLIEQTLLTSPELQAELESLRQMVTLLQTLPSMPAPRPFTLTEADIPELARPAKPGWGVFPAWVMDWMGSAAMLLILVAMGIFLFGPLKLGSNSKPEAASEIAMQQPKEEAKATEAPKEEAAKVEPTQILNTAPIAPAAVAATVAPQARAAESSSANEADAAASAPAAKMAAQPMMDTMAKEETAPPISEESLAFSAEAESDTTPPEIKATEIITMQAAKEAAPFGMTATEGEAITETVILEPTVITPTATVTPTVPAPPPINNNNWVMGLIGAILLVIALLWTLRRLGKV